MDADACCDSLVDVDTLVLVEFFEESDCEACSDALVEAEVEALVEMLACPDSD